MKTKVLDTDSENLTKEERYINELFEDVLNYMMIEKINKVVIPDKYGEKDFQISLDLVSKISNCDYKNIDFISLKCYTNNDEKATNY